MKAYQSIALLLITAIAVSLICAACISSRRSQITPEERKQAMDATLEWGRLAPFPSSAREFTIEVEGGFFTRTFRSHFKAPKGDLDTWIKQSPGLMETEPTYADGKRKYTIKPGAGANRAEVTIADDGIVEIYASWS